MDLKSRIIIRCIKIDEVGRVAELVRSLQVHQKMKDVPRIPNTQDMMKDLLHKIVEGDFASNNNGTYTAVAVDTSKMDLLDQAYIVGYLIYTQSFSIIQGRHFYMNSFFIQESYRQCGLGRKFMDYMKLHAKAMGNQRAVVPFMNDNLIGQKFYSNYDAYLVNDDYQIMAKKLDL